MVVLASDKNGAKAKRKIAVRLHPLDTNLTRQLLDLKVRHYRDLIHESLAKDCILHTSIQLHAETGGLKQ